MYNFPQPNLQLPPQETGTKTRRVDVLQCPEPFELESIRDSFCGSTGFYCPDTEIVFGLADGVAGERSHKRDYSSFLMKGSGITFELIKEGAVVASLNNNSLGTYYASFPNQPTYSGYLLDWSLVLQAFGVGKYCVRTSTTFGGTDYTFQSRKFRLYVYKPELAHRTIKLESFQDGNIVRSPFDFTGLVEGGWYSSIRARGTFGEFTAEFEKDDYLDTDYKAQQNQSETTIKWLLRLEGISQKLAFEIVTEYLLANKILLTDYNLKRVNPKRSFEVRPEAFAEFNNPTEDLVSTNIEFLDAKQNIIKRNA